MKIPIKKGVEIDRMREAGITARAILRSLADLIAPGITTGEVDSAASRFMRENGCRSAFLNYKGFPGHICISINEEVVHGIGGKRVIQYGDLVKLDVGVFKEGWVGDTATTVPVGIVDAETERLLQVTRESLFAGMKEARDGNRLGDVCSAIERVVVAAGFSVVREFVGHGVGRRLHEEPQVPNFGRKGTGPRLRPGMTLAIEPMVNAGRPAVKQLSDGWTVITGDGSLSAHYEHTVLITDAEPEILTKDATVTV